MKHKVNLVNDSIIFSEFDMQPTRITSKFSHYDTRSSGEFTALGNEDTEVEYSGKSVKSNA